MHSVWKIHFYQNIHSKWNNKFVWWNSLMNLTLFVGWSLLATVISYFVCISVGLYWTFAIYKFQLSPYVFEAFISMLSLALSICTLFHSVETFRLNVSLKDFFDLKSKKKYQRLKLHNWFLLGFWMIFFIF